MDRLAPGMARRHERQTGQMDQGADRPTHGQARQYRRFHDMGTLADAHTAMARDGLDGVGFVFTHDDPYTGIDLDSRHDPATGEIHPNALALIHRFGTFAELSVSGTGIHIVVHGTLPSCNKKGAIEAYDRGRFFTFTGCPLVGFEAIADTGDDLATWHRETFPPKPHVPRPAPPSTPIGRETKDGQPACFSAPRK